MEDDIYHNQYLFAMCVMSSYYEANQTLSQKIDSPSSHVTDLDMNHTSVDKEGTKQYINKNVTYITDRNIKAELKSKQL